MKKTLLIVFAVLFVWIFVFFLKEGSPDFVGEAIPEKELPLDKKIGQMFMIGIEGKTMTEETERIIKELHPGSVLLLSKNIGTEDELKKLAEDLQKIAIEDTGLPLFIA